MNRLARSLFPVVIAMSLGPAIAAPTSQAQPAPAIGAADDPEERLDEGLKGFGYLAGLARVCVAAAQQGDLEREVLDMNGSIGRLFGTDRAFLFAAAYGYGRSIRVEQKDCADILTNYEARAAKHRAAAGGAK